MFKNYLIIFCIVFLSNSVLAIDKSINSVDAEEVNSRELSPHSRLETTNNEKNTNSFSLKNVMKSEKESFTLINNLISIIDVESPKQIEKTLATATKNLFISSYFTKTPLLSDFIFRVTKKPESLTRFLMLFLNKNKLVLFGMIFLSTMVFSHFLGEYKFKFEPLSIKRLAYALARFSITNSTRLISFAILFRENYIGILNIFTQSVSAFQADFPILHVITSILS